MSFYFLDSSARSAWLAATTQQAQLEALAALWSGDVWAKFYSSAGTHLATVTYGTPTIDTGTTPRSLRLGAWVAESHVQDGTAAYCILAVPAGADILRCDVSLAGAISDPGGRVRLDIGTTLRVQATAGLPTVDLPAWVSALTVGQWTEVGGTNLSTAGVRQAQFVGGSGENPIDGWGGWAVNGTDIYLTGGGHSNGADNSVYKIDLSTDTPAWSRAADGSASADWVQYHTISAATKYAGYNLDDRPTAAHIYRWMAYAGGKIVRYRYFQDYGSTEASAMAIAPLGQGWTNLLDPTTGAWSLGAVAPSFYSADADGSGNPYERAGMVTDGTLIYALWQNRGYGDGSIRLMSYNPATGAYAVIGSDQGTVPTTGYGGGLYDSSRGEMVLIPENGSNLQRFSLSTGARTQTALTGAQSGFSSGWDSTYMGACYDSTRDLYYAYAGQSGTGQTLYQIDPANSYATTTVTTSGTPTTTASAGLNSRMVHLADYDVIVMQPAWNSSLWALKRS